MDVNLKDQDILLVREKGSNEVKVAGTDKDGKVKQTKPDSENPDFLKIDKHGNILENFFENFKRQVKDPTRFEFFRVPAEKFKEVIQKLQDAFKNPDKPENKAFIDLHRIDPEDFLKKHGQAKEQTQPQAQTSDKSYAISPDSVQWNKLEKFGITRESLEKTGNLEKMLDYRKTDLMPVSIKIDDETTLRTDARFSLRRQEDGSFVPAVHPIRHKPDLERPYFGVTFTKEDKDNLLTNGNLGRVVDAEFRQGEKMPILLSLDKLTNELVAFRSDKLNVPEKIKGVELSGQQRKELSEGKAVHLDNMMSKNGKEFSASIQFNADKRSFEFLFDNDRKQNQKQENGQRDVQKTFRGKELTGDQRDSLREGKTVHVDGLVDKKGKGYSGYITLNKETGKTDFMFSKQYKEALAAGKVIPDNRSKTQVAVNSEGKTSEATKNVKEPLKQGQTKPTEKQAEKQEKKTAKKAKGVKM
ncbi:MAG: DUF3945 domain-containing protein [Bacteroidales bacterium]|nr:DUF3945 domain-containing protein [Bacteroidales bacterium]